MQEDLLDVNDLKISFDLLRDVLDVLTIVAGEEDGLDARTVSTDQFLFNAANRHHAAS